MMNRCRNMRILVGMTKTSIQHISPRSLSAQRKMGHMVNPMNLIDKCENRSAKHAAVTAGTATHGTDDVSLEEDSNRGRKRERDPAKWQRNIRKVKSAKGQSYINHKGKPVGAKKIGPPCQCKKGCFEKIGTDYIKRTFDDFYGIGDKNLQNSHLFGLIQSNKVKRRRARSGERDEYRQASYTYGIRKGGARVEVCAKAFRSVHGLGKSRLEKLRKPDITVTPQDKRGKHGNQRKINASIRQKVQDHIGRSAKKMDNVDKVKELDLEKEQHLRKADKASSILKSLSEEAKTSDSIDMYTFDFQQNLPVPTLTSSDMFYSRILWVYNFGVHDMSTGDGIMHVWDETVAKRGSSEVCSCLQSTILTRHVSAKRLVVFSDSCCGQNKNKAIIDMWAWMASGNPYDQIYHMYLIRGHTFLPNDRDFAQIEKYKRKHKVVLPSEYSEIIRDARITQPFEVKVMRCNDFKDHKGRADKNIKSTLKDDKLELVKLRDVMWFSYGSSQEMDFMENKFVKVPHPNQVWCRFTHNELEPWKKVSLLKRGATLGGNLEAKYTQPIPLKEAKYKDLMALGDKGLVAEQVKEFYASLPHQGDSVGNNVVDSDSDDNCADYV